MPTGTVADCGERRKWAPADVGLLYREVLSQAGVIDVDVTIDLTLVSRCYERYVEHAVAIARCGALLAMGAPRG